MCFWNSWHERMQKYTCKFNNLFPNQGVLHSVFSSNILNIRECISLSLSNILNIRECFSLSLPSLVSSPTSGSSGLSPEDPTSTPSTGEMNETNGTCVLNLTKIFSNICQNWPKNILNLTKILQKNCQNWPKNIRLMISLSLCDLLYLTCSLLVSMHQHQDQDH